MLAKFSFLKSFVSSLVVIGLLSVSFSCNMPSPYFQKQFAIPKTQWDYSFKPVFKIEIKDTSAKYRMYLLVRHDEAYPFANIWFRLNEKTPGEKSFKEGERINKVLADAEGKWLGKGMGGIWEHKIPFTTKEGLKFNHIGVYEIQMEQLMRTNPLPSVLNVGLLIEKMN